MMTPQEPSSTRLINIPVLFNNRKSFLLLYTNDLEVHQDPIMFKSPQLSFDQQGSSLNEFFAPLTGGSTGGSTSLDSINNVDDQHNPNTALMIVPIPNPNNETVFGLVSASDPQIKKFRHSVHNLGEDLMEKYRRKRKNLRGYLANNFSLESDSLKIVRVGNYDISVAPNYQDLLERINWDHFKLPPDFEKRKATLSNKELYPENMAYVVAKAVKSIKDDGFGIIYPGSHHTYFPTAHEDTQSFQSYDVLCYDFTDQNLKYPFLVGDTSYIDEKYYISSDNGNVTTLTNSNLGEIRNVLRELPLECQTNQGKEEYFKIDFSRIKVMNLIPIKTQSTNQNISLKRIKSILTQKPPVTTKSYPQSSALLTDNLSEKPSDEKQNDNCSIF